jgi:uncharacterized LabA/DUF88 family protein
VRRFLPELPPFRQPRWHTRENRALPHDGKRVKQSPTNMTQSHPNSIALLIDADNAPAGKIEFILSELAAHGVVNIRRAYGNWTKSDLNGWIKVLHENSIQPMQSFDLVKGKNATDMALVIDAMDLLYTKRLSTFCLVSSDSDFTRLATRIREAGLVVYGFGEKKTPTPFVAACDKFVYTEILRTQQEPVPAPKLPHAQPPVDPKKEDSKSADKIKEIVKLEQMIRAAVTAIASDDGWVPLGQVGSMLLKNNPSFDPRNYGYPKLGELARKQKYLELKEVRSVKGTPNVHIHVRLRRANAPQNKTLKSNTPKA